MLGLFITVLCCTCLTVAAIAKAVVDILSALKAISEQISALASKAKKDGNG